jgi:hypothetical protein
MPANGSNGQSGPIAGMWPLRLDGRRLVQSSNAVSVDDRPGHFFPSAALFAPNPNTLHLTILMAAEMSRSGER